MVLEIPPAVGGTIVGTVMDCWQTPLEDVGYAGVDKGKGGKYLILPPGYKEKAPASPPLAAGRSLCHPVNTRWNSRFVGTISER